MTMSIEISTYICRKYIRVKRVFCQKYTYLIEKINKVRYNYKLQRRGETDIENRFKKSVLIEISGEEENKGISVPPRKETNAVAERRGVTEYSGTGAVCHVRISPWPTKFVFYSRFFETALRMWSVDGEKAEYTGFFSYMPRYEQMSAAQKKYYLYWRSLVKSGIYPYTDSSYIILLLYEIINLSDKISTEYGCELIARIWVAYRDTYPYLDKYAGEWLCDYILIHRVPVPYEIISPIFASAMSSLTYPEILMSGTGEDIPESYIRERIKSVYSGSRYYTKENKDLYDAHITEAVMRAFGVMAEKGLYSNIKPIRASRDSYSGAVVCNDSKYEIEISYKSLLKSREFASFITNSVKFAENQLRAAIGIKSRYAKLDLPGEISDVIVAYFDEVYPNRFAKSAKKDDSEEYMKYYEPEKSEADIGKAFSIEEDAWKTAEELGACELPEEKPDISEKTVIANETPGPHNEYEAFVRLLDDKLTGILCAAFGDGFLNKCREENILPSEAERIINEAAYDSIGDIALENGHIIEDYSEGIYNAIERKG